MKPAFLSIASVFIVCVGFSAHGGVNENSYEVLENGAGRFRVEIDGCPVASANVESITVEDLVIDEREMSTGADWDYRVYGPGDVHYGSITVRSRMGTDSKELYQWWLDCSRGKNIRKNITVTVLDQRGNPVREFFFLDCFPTRWDPGEYSPSSNVACETIVAKMGRVELAAMDTGGSGGRPGFTHRRAGPRDLRPPLFEVSLLSGEGNRGSGTDVDSAWETCTGGALNFEILEGGVVSVRGDQFHTTTPGHKYIDAVTLSGPLTSGRQSLCQWVSSVASGWDTRFDVSIKEITKDGSPGKSYTYLDCFPTRYVFPAFQAGDDSGLLEERVVIKPIRIELP